MQIISPDLNIDFLRYRKITIGLSLIVIALGIAAAIARGGIPTGIDFAGGTEFQLRFDPGVTVDEGRLRDVVRGAGFLDATVVRFGEVDASEFLVKFKERPDESAGAEPEVEDGLEANTRVARLEATIRQAIGPFVEQRVEYVGPKVGADLRRDGANSMLMAAIAILIYIAFRFNARYAPGAVVATFHDVFLTAGILVMANIEFDLQILAALLAIVGYSLNDTIIIYDRIRENLELHPAQDLEAVLNLSVNQTMSRTVLTAGTTVLAVLALLFLGGEVIFPFSFTMLIGIVVGTYSSIFIASPLLLFLERRYGDRKTRGGTGKRSATRERTARA
ncbi:MAG: protein translocase subunit SecF [Myxococcota bacterium]